MWGDEQFTFHDRYHHTDGAHVKPPPVQLPSPPLKIAGGGQRVTLRQVVQEER